MIVIGIETSCDDTSIGIIKSVNDKVSLLAHESFSQDEILKTWQGVVPEIAARSHLTKLPILLNQSLEKANITLKEISCIGVTTIPGLLGPLLTGLNCAKTISLLYEKPIVAVNHLFAHLEAIHLTENSITYPYLGLLVSGGHSIYFLVNAPNDFIPLGSTIDDAAGEAFDKGGKLLGLGYPAGRVIDELSKSGDPHKYSFPIGLKQSADARLSFSGLKTSLRVFLSSLNEKEIKENMQDICASYQTAIVSALSLKLRYALAKAKEITSLKNIPIVVGGGVACNTFLRSHLSQKYNDVYFVSPVFCTDNGAMIANFALRNISLKVDFPQCLQLDARGRYINKKEYQK